MGKRNRKNRKPQSVLTSFKELGNSSRDTLSRFATTVKTELPTLMIGPSGNSNIKADPQPLYGRPSGQTLQSQFKLSDRSETKLSAIAKKINPFRRSDSSADAETTRKMKHLAHQMAQGNSKMKIRRSRLPALVAVVSVVLMLGGYYAYQSISVPTEKLTPLVDYKGWMGSASGQKLEAERRIVTNDNREVDVVKSYSNPVSKSSWSGSSSQKPYKTSALATKIPAKKQWTKASSKAGKSLKSGKLASHSKKHGKLLAKGKSSKSSKATLKSGKSKGPKLAKFSKSGAAKSKAKARIVNSKKKGASGKVVPASYRGHK